MRPFYIIKNKHGFYSVSFVNQTTGKRTAWKSTHTSDYSEAMLIASTWYKDGSPSEQARTALRLSKQENKSSGIDVEKLIARLSDAEAKLLYIKLAAKFGSSVPVLNATPTPVVQTEPVNDLSVEKHISKKKVIVVHKKNALAESGLLRENVAQKVYEPLKQKSMGYSLSGDVKEQCLFILWGTGANGKSTFLNTLQTLFGDYACSTGTETFMKKTSEQSNDLARLKDIRLVTTMEVEQGKALSESLIKQITGGDEITARFLYGEFFSFKPTFKIYMATNHKPKIRGADNGIWRRIKMIPFTVTIPPEQRDNDLGNKLLAENSGILNWLIEGVNMWKKEGLKNEPDAIKEANEEYRFDMDSVGTFIADCFSVDATDKWRVHTKIMYDTYLKWCQKNNERVMSQKWLGMRLQEKGIKRLASNSQRFWLGLVLKDEWRV